MEQRLNQLFGQLRVSPSRFADEIGVQRSNISHLLSGRNKPSFDLMVKIIERYPKVDIEWLITGKGEPLKREVTIQPDASGNRNPDIFNSPAMVQSSPPPVYANKAKSESSVKVTNVNSVEKVLIFYSDKTFEEYRPSGG